ncbi:hypothetical protein L210DRAFT_750185 [Boletus edulis BED1]|uniref:Uncharacterized protein n=1 Tax=Boletus edulis BED1 TaxID=1328754 RepID=A0AAD4BI59_BOLED|nr:hypothetical protein L210DRAFT_750185 [Boletus edulis BED1]
MASPEEHRACMMRCVLNQHLCGKRSKFSGRHDICAKVIDHIDEEHLCAAPVPSTLAGSCVVCPTCNWSISKFLIVTAYDGLYFSACR